MRESTLNSTEKQEKLPLIGEKEILEWSQKQLTKTEIIPLDKTVLAYVRDKKGNLILAAWMPQWTNFTVRESAFFLS